MQTPLLLAPMVGLTHSALRTLILSFGGAGLLTTEMLSARRLPSENPDICPYLFRTREERPLAYQLFLTAEEELAPALALLERWGADVVDLNLGCPAPKIRLAGGGSALMDDRGRVARLVATARKLTDLPLTAKIRLGESLDLERLKGFCRMLEEEGVDLLTVHARLRGESFARPPRWECIARVREWVAIPVVANGGIDSVAAARRCLAETGADGLMIGRAAARQPWLFAEIARNVYGADIPVAVPDLPAVYLQFAESLCERFRPERRLGRLKEFTHYFSANYSFGHRLAAAVQSSQDMGEAWQGALSFFRLNEAGRDLSALEEWSPGPVSGAGD